MFQYSTIATEDDSIQLTCLITKDRGPCMTSIEFKNIKNKKYPDQSLFWDNDKYIFGKFKKFLKRHKKNRLKKKDKKEFSDVFKILRNGLVAELLDMLKEAESQGWYKKEENDI